MFSSSFFVFTLNHSQSINPLLHRIYILTEYFFTYTLIEYHISFKKAKTDVLFQPFSHICHTFTKLFTFSFSYPHLVDNCSAKINPPIGLFGSFYGCPVTKNPFSRNISSIISNVSSLSAITL